MSVSDKAAQVNSAHGIPKTLFGIVDYADITSSCGTNITCQIITRNNFQKFQMNLSTLHIPTAFRVESLHSSGHGGTIFPVPSLLGCTWNRTLMKMIGETIALEATVYGIEMGFAPVLQVLTDPRFGRFTESYGGDPILVTQLGYSMSNGLSGGGNLSEYILPNHIYNEAKHFVGYAFGGKDGLPCDVSERRLREIYLRPWQAFAASGGRSIMASHNSVNGMAMHANKQLLTDVMRNEFDWQNGLIASDCADIQRLYVRSGPWQQETGFHIASDMNGAVLKSMEAGMDVSLCDDIRSNVEYLISNAIMNESTLDRAVSNVLRFKFASGLMDNPIIANVSNARTSIINNSSARSLAKQAALQGIVLLKNANKLLPLSANMNAMSIAVIGPIAGNAGSYYGPYANGGAAVVTLMDALGANSDKYNFTMKHSVGCDAQNLSINSAVLGSAIDMAKQSDYVIMVVGDTLNTCGENHDRVGLELPGGQLYLINEITKIKKDRTIIVYLGTRPATFGTGLWNMFSSIESNGIGVRDNALLDNVSALISAFHPGEEGGNALLDIIFGSYNPSARLSSSWPQSAAHVHSLHSPFLKSYQGHENFDYVYNSIDPLFPFGYGLSYIDIEHSKSVEIKETIPNCEWTVSVNVTNKDANMDSYEIIQIYYTKWVSNVVRNELELAGFESVFVEKQSTVTAHVTINADSLSYYDVNSKQWVLESGLYYIYDALNAKDFDHWSTTKLNIDNDVVNPCKFWESM